MTAPTLDRAVSVEVVAGQMVTPGPSVHVGDHVLVGALEIVVDSPLGQAFDDDGSPVWDCDRHIVMRDEVRLHGGGDQYGVTRFPVGRLVRILRRGAR